MAPSFGGLWHRPEANGSSENVQKGWIVCGMFW
jgi:hypothetical protein